MAAKLLKFINYAENGFCIHRSYCLYSKVRRVLSTIHIITETLFTFVNLIIRTYIYIKNYSTFAEVLVCYLSLLNTLVVIILGCYHTKKYKTLLENLESDFKIENKSILPNVKTKEHLMVVLIFLVNITYAIYFGFLYMTTMTFTTALDMPAIWRMLFQIHLSLSDFRYLFEFFVMYWILRTISAQVEAIVHLIENKNPLECDTQQFILDLDKFTLIYKQIRESSMNYNCIFGVQVCT